jgi:hypothetical protein
VRKQSSPTCSLYFSGKRSSGATGKVSPAASLMLKQEELALLGTVSSGQGNPVFLRELRKALAAKKSAKATACCTAKTSCVALWKRHANITGKRKAELSRSDGLIIPAARTQAPDTPGTSAAPTQSTSRQLEDSAGKAAYAAVVAGDTKPRQPSGQPNP